MYHQSGGTFEEKRARSSNLCYGFPENLQTSWSKYFPGEIRFKPGIGIIEAFARPFGIGEVKRKFNALLDDFHPDVVHVHNIHSQLRQS